MRGSLEGPAATPNPNTDEKGDDSGEEDDYEMVEWDE